ncbi:hypothetical protein T265_07702 [Opisthorchis viverrini]|uniref:Uncharacterized protein n=1 Tax=Opisthorchis viverrini TaxID=6198 RepID=A0A074ZGD0_OPIVI|nr:hypothetical protein T265_07702 [Opisthorchis viverrini]KER24702.1 hypothetical protein T265_07702 [Opisthorchis viverrini]
MTQHIDVATEYNREAFKGIQATVARFVGRYYVCRSVYDGNAYLVEQPGNKGLVTKELMQKSSASSKTQCSHLRRARQQFNRSRRNERKTEGNQVVHQVRQSQHARAGIIYGEPRGP